MSDNNQITIDHINDFFTIGKRPKQIYIAPTVTGGLGINNLDSFPPPEIPKSYRNRGTEYAKKYIEEERKLETETARHQTVELPGGSCVNIDELTSMNALEELSTIQANYSSIDDLYKEEAAQLYSTYYKTLNVQYNSGLPITEYKEKVLQFININQVVVIQGSTGCGKTTQVPQYILDYHARVGKHCNIVVTQPRKIAAVSVARRVCQERKWEMGTIVGYQVALDNKISPDTRISYVTTGVLLQKLVNSRRMDMYTHVIIDEVHERDQDTDFCLLVVKKLLRTNSRSVKVILMSATIDTSLFAKYFSLPGSLQPAPVIELSRKYKEVAEYYLDSLDGLGGIKVPELDPTVPRVPKESIHLAVKLIFVFDNIEKAEQNVEKRFAPSRGTVLIFLPGLEEISEMSDVLKEEGCDKKFWILPLHSSITVEEQSRVFSSPPEGHRKVIIATNIAESSITVPDIKYVIDFCVTKNLVSDPETNYTCLQLEWASKANCTQRKGRAGRVDIGRVYRMVPGKFYNDVLPEYGVPEIKRCPLEQTVLHTKKLNFGEPQALLALALEPPALSDIERAILVLKEVGALAVTANGIVTPFDGDMTFIGKVMAKLPLDVRISKLIILSYVFNCLEECLIIAASLSLKSFHSKPFKRFLDAYKSRLSWANGTFSDCLAFLNAYRIWKDHVRKGTFLRPGGLRENEWGGKNFIQIKSIKEVDMLVEELKKRLATANISVNYNRRRDDEAFEILILKIVIAGAFFPNYFLQEEIDEREILKQITDCDPLTTVLVSGLPANQGLLYARDIEAMMMKCCSSSSSRSCMDISFEERKAFVQFSRSQDRGTDGYGILPAVYLAVKLRQLRMPLKLQLYSNEEAQRKMEQLRERKKEKCEKNKSLWTNRITVNLSHPTSNPPILPGLNQLTVRIFITHIVDCGHFWAQYIEGPHERDRRFLSHAISSYCGENFQPENFSREIGMLVLAPYADKRAPNIVDYYRARIEDMNGSKIKVFFIDYGNIEVVDSEKLKKIDEDNTPDILTMPAQAFECMLSEVKPSSLTSPNGLWTKNATRWFAENVSGKELIARVYSVIQQIVRVELTKHSPDGSEININKQLINEKHAEPAKESLASLQDNSLRMRTEELACGNMLNSSDKGLKFSLNDAKEFQGTKRSSYGKETYLHGPFSPLEISYSGITRLGGFKSVKIERDSVNSVSLTAEPQDKHAHMLVACHVGLNPKSGTLSARNTTLMPNLHGLPSLICLLFSPTAELRTDPKRICYTGAVCGLGYDPANGKSLYPEHDIELPFDTSIDYDDISTINSIRMGINLILNTEEDLAEYLDEGLHRIQSRVREEIFRLLIRKRKSQTPYSFPRRYCWQQVPTEHVLSTELEGSSADCPYVLPLLKAINLATDTIQESLKENIKELYAIAGRSTELIASKCRLCGVILQTPRELTMHLQTSEHRQKEDELFN